MVSYSKYLLIGLPVVALAGFAALWWQRNMRRRSYKEVGRVSGLFFYPVKSCKGIRVHDAKCLKEGMEYDRHWVVLDGKGNFASQRKDPKLALVVPHFEDGKYLCLNAPGMEMLKLDIQLQADKKEYKMIKIFGMEGEGQYVGDEAAEWFSYYLKKPGYKMYQLSKHRLIQEDDDWGDIGRPGDKVSFGDFAPYMILAEDSLAEVNKELPSPVTMERFRPNVVVSGMKAFEEDKWETGRRIKIGDVVFRFLNRCGRCSLPTVNPKTGEKKGLEPLVTLRRIRLPEDRDPRYGDSPLFGIYAAPDGDGVGVIRQGDSVTVWS
ncbi:hypothetical protein ACROYT_G041376 [Oculina patagonica]